MLPPPNMCVQGSHGNVVVTGTRATPLMAPGLAHEGPGYGDGLWVGGLHVCGWVCNAVCMHVGVPGPVCTSPEACGHPRTGWARIPGHNRACGPNCFSWVDVEGGRCRVLCLSVRVPRGAHPPVCPCVTASLGGGSPEAGAGARR